MQLQDAMTQYGSVFCIFVALLGLTVGSFINVVCLRLPKMAERDWRNQCCELLDVPDPSATDAVFNLAFPSSHCPKCGHAIRAWENIPVLSYLALRGKCSGCSSPISVRYPVIETISGVLCAVVAWRFGFTWECAAALLLTWSLLCLAVIDFDTQLLLDDITLPLLWAGLLIANCSLFTPLQSAVIGAASGYLILWSVHHLFKWVTGKEGMGYGDFKLLAALGAWMGWQALPLIILMSSILGAITGMSLVLFRKRDKQIPIPFGPFLAGAGWVSLLWGDTLSSWYLSTTGL